MPLPAVTLWITPGADFTDSFALYEPPATIGGPWGPGFTPPVNFSAGRFFIQFAIAGLSSGAPLPIPTGASIWEYVVGGAGASIVVPGSITAGMTAGTTWQLLWLPEPGIAGLAVRAGIVAHTP
jgi:hypothetical protein